jgi:UDP-N-acetylmuramate: L-alanyl-gamma-D-glutamyl-meso-diaminopimelate ligase
MFVVGNVVSSPSGDGTAKFPLMEAILNSGAPYMSGPQAGWKRAAGTHVLRSGWQPMANHSPPPCSHGF